MNSRTMTVNVNGLNFNCRIDGPEGAPWLVFTNSLLTNLAMWDEQVAALGDRYRILRYDQRGHGATEVPESPATILDLGDDLAALMEKFDVAGATVIGISMGVGTLIAAYRRISERVAKLVLADGVAVVKGEGIRAMWDARIAQVRAGGMEALVEPTVTRWFRPEFLQKNGEPLARVRAMIRTTPIDGYAACANALCGYDLTAVLPEIACPVLLISGEHDHPVPQAMAAMREVLPNARYVELAGCGHIPALEQPAAFTAALENFLRT